MAQQNLTERGMAVGLRALNRLASNGLIDRFGLRDPAQRVLHTASKATVRTATRAGRTFAATQKLSKPARQPRTGRSDLFDLTPDDEQQMLRESVRDFALAKLRPAAQQADEACATPNELLEQANELGLTMVGVPEELGGAVAERSAVTTVLMAEALAQGDMGIAVACLAPAGVSTALSLWGDADQQATYLPEFVGENVPAAALALLEPRPLFNPFELQTRARRTAGGFVLDGVKSLVPRAGRRRAVHRRRAARGFRRTDRPRCSSWNPEARDSRSSPSPEWGSAPPPPAGSCSRARRYPPARCSARAAPM